MWKPVFSSVFICSRRLQLNSTLDFKCRAQWKAVSAYLADAGFRFDYYLETIVLYLLDPVFRFYQILRTCVWYFVDGGLRNCSNMETGFHEVLDHCFRTISMWKLESRKYCIPFSKNIFIWNRHPAFTGTDLISKLAFEKYWKPDSKHILVWKQESKTYCTSDTKNIWIWKLASSMN